MQRSTLYHHGVTNVEIKRERERPGAGSYDTITITASGPDGVLVVDLLADLDGERKIKVTQSLNMIEVNHGVER